MTCHHPTSWITSLGKCVCGEQVENRHTHTPVKDSLGQNVCSVCHMIVINPILSSDDPRLNPPQEDYWPLPEILVALYYDGPEYGLPKAPIAPYVRDVAAMEGEIARYDAAVLWDTLAERVM